MGEIADDMIDGTCCQLCGCYFEGQDDIYTHGYPVVCRDCWRELTKDERKLYQKAQKPTL